MLPNHFMQCPLDAGKGTVAYFAKKPQGRLLVFVHGFGGHPISTWREMHELVVSDPSVAGCDIVFYGYDSRRFRALIHAATFREFVDSLQGANSKLVAQMPEPRRTSQQVYQRIVIAAHSLGVPVVRQALLMDYLDTRKWANKARVVCFAPAHRGAAIQKLATTASSSGLGSIFYAIGLATFPVLQDLHPKDSDFLVELVKSHEKHMPKCPAPPLRAQNVVFGDQDDIVEVLMFHESEPFTRWPGHDHFTVCKAHAGFREPLDIVLGAFA